MMMFFTPMKFLVPPLCATQSLNLGLCEYKCNAIKIINYKFHTTAYKQENLLQVVKWQKDIHLKFKIRVWSWEWRNKFLRRNCLTSFSHSFSIWGQAPNLPLLVSVHAVTVLPFFKAKVDEGHQLERSWIVFLFWWINNFIEMNAWSRKIEDIKFCYVVSSF